MPYFGYSIAIVTRPIRQPILFFKGYSLIEVLLNVFIGSFTYKFLLSKSPDQSVSHVNLKTYTGTCIEGVSNGHIHKLLTMINI
jgi:hypothetical protein